MTLELRGLPHWPGCLSYKEAILYTRLSTSELRRGIRDGDLVFKPLGPNGRKIIPRDHLDGYIRKLFNDVRKPVPIEEDMDFGPDPTDEEIQSRRRRRRGR